MDAEEVIINLKLLSQVEKGQKLITRDAYLNIEGPYLFVPEFVRRWRRQDSRHETVKCINRVVNDAIALLKKDPAMKLYIRQAKSGIMNLKETYSMCHQTCARLDMILDKIKVYDSIEVELDPDL
jgi:hypothetical protein|uniref:Uncharacterized protein n=1 Tax=viral metagenome TaxID=1070528 RepID=A0A6C0HXP4_9ZZZZ